MFRCASLTCAALLAALPAAAASLSTSICNGQSAELASTAGGTTLTVNGTDVPLDKGYVHTGLSCVSRDGATLFGLIRSAGDVEEYLLLDPATLEVSQVTYEEAEALNFWETEDDWFDEE